MKFPCSDVQDMLIESGLLGDVELIVTGKLIDCTTFEGTDMIRRVCAGMNIYTLRDPSRYSINCVSIVKPETSLKGICSPPTST